MSDTGATLRIADLSPARPNRVHHAPDDATRAAMVGRLGLQALRKALIAGEIVSDGPSGWRLEARIGATAVQTCVVTLEPVTTRIDTTLIRRYLPADQLPDPEPGTESEMPEDESLDALPDAIDLDSVFEEALALSLPDYPRKDDAALDQAVFAEDGVPPMTDDDARPFAGLKSLRDKLQGGD